ncbi:hypothetical protein PQ465_04870 [Sphingobacterium oryzagri]|uniref:Uncharacterized protein n=1 Tax=Sphingobacterium oryzagri TaxID=3025669 RepID=A0ABY7WN37_9SPHI|nr:hypothetical protein [Sphingobacterium sp. KACC 22765]WDF69715.1 hypothetical protein PQ465_04870 [Sphingobacterium sp. KACC 22765]
MLKIINRMSSQFDIDKIVDYLIPLKDKLPHSYKWNADLSKLIPLGLLTNESVQDLNDLTPYEKEIRLKNLVRAIMVSSMQNDPQLFDELCAWIVRDWGGIRAAKEDSLKQLTKSFLEKRDAKFERIASISKIAAYLFPEENIIYDSRVAYSLNWILLSQDAGKRFFPVPEGRNSKMCAFDINVLIRLKYVDFYLPNSSEGFKSQKKFISKVDKKLFMDKDTSYRELNSLIKKVSERLWTDDLEKSTKLYYTEMLLFSIADTEIFYDITSSMSSIVQRFKN